MSSGPVSAFRATERLRSADHLPLSQHGTMKLNRHARRLAAEIGDQPHRWNVRSHLVAGARVIDLGVQARGGLECGARLAEICMGGLGTVRLTRPHTDSAGSLSVEVITDHPLLACLGSQYAGWPIKHDDYFAMGSGPMRLLRGREPILRQLDLSEEADVAVGVLESSALPGERVVRAMADECGVAAEQMTLLVARTRSLAGMIQIVARSVETTLHKLAELSTDDAPVPLESILAAAGTAPLPPPPRNDLEAIGRTNDAILYGAQVVLWVEGELERWKELVERIPSGASSDYGRPFAEIFQHYQGDFYAIDPLLFSPAVVRIEHVSSGCTLRAGQTDTDLLRRSFGENYREGPG